MANILIVDDSATVRTQLKNDLIGEGYGIFEASTGLEGLRLLAENPDRVDLVFCDVNMPEMDGLTMCREIRKNLALCKIPVIMLTTQAGAEIKEEGESRPVSSPGSSSLTKRKSCSAAWPRYWPGRRRNFSAPPDRRRNSLEQLIKMLKQ